MHKYFTYLIWLWRMSHVALIILWRLLSVWRIPGPTLTWVRWLSLTTSITLRWICLWWRIWYIALWGVPITKSLSLVVVSKWRIGIWMIKHHLIFLFTSLEIILLQSEKYNVNFCKVKSLLQRTNVQKTCQIILNHFITWNIDDYYFNINFSNYE